MVSADVRTADDDGCVVLMGIIMLMIFIRMVSYDVDVGGNKEEYWE